MTVRAFVTLATLGMLCVQGGDARADEPVPAPVEDTAPPPALTPPPMPPEDAMRRIRELHEQGDFIGVRRELLAVYAQTPHPSLLFALGQVEFNLGHYEAAISYYERFLATGPEPEYVALAQQAVGAARGRIALPKDPPPPPRPRRHRTWETRDTSVVAIGGAAVLVGVGLILYGRHLGNDRSGSLADYDARTDRATTLQWTGAGIGTAGVLAVGITFLRWRLRPEDGDGDGERANHVIMNASARGASLIVSWRW